MGDSELDQILADEIETRLPLLQPGSGTPEVEIRAALHSLRGATAMAGHLELSVLLAQTSSRIRQGDPEARRFVHDLLARAATRLRDGKPPLQTRWPEPPPGLMVLPLAEDVRPEYVASMRDRLAQLDEALSATASGGLDAAYRAVHGMKSAAAGAGDDVTAWFCHGLESALQQTPRTGREATDLRLQLSRYRAVLALLIEDPTRGLEALGRSAPGGFALGSQPPAPAARQPSVAAPEELRVSTVALDRALERLTAIDRVQDELRSVVELGQRRTGRLRELRARLLELPQLAAESSETDFIARVEELARGLHAVALTSSRGLAALRRAAGQLGTASREVHQELTGLRVTKAGWLFSRAIRGIVEQATAENKLVTIATSGDDVPLDRPLADKALGALSQLVRNAVAHGIEPPELRESRGKPKEGRIELKASRTASALRIEVNDDGRGVDFDELRRTALSLGVDPEQAVHATAEQELVTLLALPGLTTRDAPDLLAGRGMGLHLAQQTALALGGALTLQSQPKQGFSAWLDLPLEGALPQVIWVEAGTFAFALPSQCVQAVAPAEAGARQVTLADLLHLTPAPPATTTVELLVPGLPALLLGVDHVGDIDRVLVHTVPDAVQQAGPFSGAVRAADGTLHLVLDPRALVLRASALGANTR